MQKSYGGLNVINKLLSLKWDIKLCIPVLIGNVLLAINTYFYSLHESFSVNILELQTNSSENLLITANGNNHSIRQHHYRIYWHIIPTYHFYAYIVI